MSRPPQRKRTVCARRIARASAPVLLAAALGGCGVSTRTPPAERGTDIARSEAGPVFSSRPQGTVLAEGAPLDVLTPLVSKPFSARGSGAVSFTKTTSQQSFADLCSGRVDLIEPGRVSAPGEAATCARNHLTLLGPLDVAWDSLVLAAKNEADIGGDCLSTQQVRDIFRAGSPYTNWSQLGFADVPLTSAGSLSEPVSDELFARSVLGQPTLSAADLRENFTSTQNATATRRQIVGSDRQAQAQAAARHERIVLRAQTDAERKRFVDAAVASADRRVLAQIAATNERNRRLKVNVNAEALDRHNARIDAAAKRAASQRANTQFDLLLGERVAKATAPLLARANVPGVIGFVRFTYYEQWEEQLRPFEIWAAGSSPGAQGAAQSPNCVFPSAQTISSGHYPFAFHLVLYTTRQALKRGVVRDYLSYLLTNEQAYAAGAGLVPVTDRQRNSDLLSIGLQPPLSATNTGKASASATSSSPAPSAPQPSASPGIPGVGVSATQGTGASAP
jgi:hypothetical protein